MKKKLDQVLEALYDENLLHWKEVPSTSLIVFGNEKYDWDMQEAELDFALEILRNDNLIRGNKKHENSQIEYSLTVKGVQFIHEGGFAEKGKKERRKNKLVHYGQIAVIIGGAYYIVFVILEIISFFIETSSIVSHFKSIVVVLFNLGI